MVKEIKDDIKRHPIQTTLGTAILVMLTIVMFGADQGMVIGGHMEQVSSNAEAISKNEERVQSIDDRLDAIESSHNKLNGQFDKFFDMYKIDRSR